MSRILECWRVTDSGRPGTEKAGLTAGCGFGSRHPPYRGANSKGVGRGCEALQASKSRRRAVSFEVVGALFDFLGSRRACGAMRDVYLGATDAGRRKGYHLLFTAEPDE